MSIQRERQASPTLGFPFVRAASPAGLTERIKAMAKTGSLQKLAVRLTTKGSPLGELALEAPEG